MMSKRFATGFSALALVLSLVMTGCGGGGGGSSSSGGNGGNGGGSQATLKSIAVTPAAATVASIPLGGTLQYHATGSYSDGSSKDLTNQATWSAGSSGNVTISSLGLATGVVQGQSAPITATMNNVTSPAVTVAVGQPLLTKISITGTNTTLAIGTSTQFSANGVFTNATSAQPVTSLVSWTSSDPTNVPVNSTGLVTVVATPASTVTITANVQGWSSAGPTPLTSLPATITVSTATLTSIAISPINASSPLGKPQQLKATGTFSDNGTQDLTSSVTWSSSDNTIASVSNASGSQGQIRSFKTGTVMVIATQGSVASSTNFTVTAAVLTSLTVNGPSATLAKGSSEQLTATGLFTDGHTSDLSSTATWKTGDSTIATVAGGLVTAVASSGTTGITAAFGSITSPAFNIAVSSATLSSIKVTPPTPNVPKGETVQFTATGTFTDSTTQDLTSVASWLSGTPGVATITSPGGLATVTGFPGSSMISATVSGVTGSTMLNASAAVLVSIAVTPAALNLPKGQTQQYTAMGTFSDGSKSDITLQVSWLSSNQSVATIIANTGFATSTGSSGTATISATSSAAMGSITGSTTVTGVPAVVASITVTPANQTVPKGETLQFKAMGTFTDGTTQDLTSTATWGSTVAAVATVNVSGGLATVTGSSGTTQITAASGAVQGSTNLTGAPAVPLSLTVTPSIPSVAKGLTQQFTATENFSDGSTQNVTATATWTATSSPSGAVTITSPGGLATANASGSAIIQAALGSFSAQTTMIVGTGTIQSIAVTPSNPPAVPLGLTQPFTATATLSDNSTLDVTGTATWVTLTPGIASISSSGLATTIAQGSTGVQASIGAIISNTATLTVGPPVLTSFSITPPSAQVLHGGVQQFKANGTFSDNSTADVTSTVTWNSSSTAVASISNTSGSNGLAVGKSLGGSTISATSGSITGSNTASLSVVAPVPRFLYAVNLNDGTVSSYSLNLVTGQLRMTGYALVGSVPSGIVIDPSNRFLYVANQVSSNVYGFAVDPESGILTPIPGSPFSDPVTGGAGALASDAAGRFLYVANVTTNNVSQFAIDPNSGGLTRVGETAAGTFPQAITIDPSGQYLYTVNNQDGTVSMFKLDPTSGIPAPLGSAAISAGPPCSPVYMAIDPNGQFAYVVEATPGSPCTGSTGGNVIGQFLLDPTTGILTANSVPSFATAANPSWIAFTPNGNTAIEVSKGGQKVQSLSVNSKRGTLSVSPSPASLTSLLEPISVTVDPTGSYAFVSQFTSDQITAFTIAPSSSPAPGSIAAVGRFIAREGPFAMAISSGVGAATYVPTFAYAINNGSNNVSLFSVASNGTLSSAGSMGTGAAPVSVATDSMNRYLYVADQGAQQISEYTIDSLGVLHNSGAAGATGTIVSIATEPSGRFAYVASAAPNALTAYSIDSTNNGNLVPVPGGTIPLPGKSPISKPATLAIDPSGRFAYAVNVDGTIVGYSIDVISGVLTSIAHVPPVSGTTPAGMAIDPTARFAYVANAGSNDVAMYSIDSQSGALTSVAGNMAAGTAPAAVAIEPTGRFVYVVNSGSGDISAYSIGATGALTQIGATTTPTGGTTPNAISVDPSGAFLYVTNSGSGNVAAFSINPTTGALTALSPATFGAGTTPDGIVVIGKIQ